MEKEIETLMAEDRRRSDLMLSPFNPVTGEGSVGERRAVEIEELGTLHLPVAMLEVPLVRQVVSRGGIGEWLEKDYGADREDTDGDRWEAMVNDVADQLLRVRCRHDFPFWAYVFVKIHPKGEGDDIPFRLSRQQRRLVALYEEQRTAGKPIRLVLAKSRQWGGSTATQIYMAWLQLVHRIGLNSIIVGHQKDSSAEVESMFKKVIEAYPVEYLYPIGAEYDAKETKYAGDPHTQNIHSVPQRKCKIKVGTAEKPDSARGGDSALVHCTEVAFWKKTEGRKPEQIVRSACAGALPKPYTMIVYESSPNGTGNFFQREYDDAKAGRSMFAAMFVACWEIETYAIPVDDREAFAGWLYGNRNNPNVPDDRSESGRFYWYMWTLGATFEAINWYVQERRKYHDHADMASEFPIDDIEAFTYSGARVFDRYKVNAFKRGCRPPQFIGEVQGRGDEGRDALGDLHFVEDAQGQLWVWDKPEIYGDEKVRNRYLAVVDIGGRGAKADWSVIVVFDRYWMIEGDKPSVVAQWYGHIDMDLLAWKAAQIAAWYDNALLVIESNTLETKDRDRHVDGDQSEFILNQIRDVYGNLYARRQSEAEIAEGAPRKYGFHTNVATKPKIISTLVKVIRDGLYIERDVRCLDEYLCYERRQNGSYGAILGKHDDLLMTRAIGLHICFKEMPLPSVITQRRTRQAKASAKRKAYSAASIV